MSWTHKPSTMDGRATTISHQGGQFQWIPGKVWVKWSTNRPNSVWRWDPWWWNGYRIRVKIPFLKMMVKTKQYVLLRNVEGQSENVMEYLYKHCCSNDAFAMRTVRVANQVCDVWFLLFTNCHVVLWLVLQNISDISQFDSNWWMELSWISIGSKFNHIQLVWFITPGASAITVGKRQHMVPVGCCSVSVERKGNRIQN